MSSEDAALEGSPMLYELVNDAPWYLDDTMSDDVWWAYYNEAALHDELPQDPDADPEEQSWNVDGVKLPEDDLESRVPLLTIEEMDDCIPF